MGTRSDVGKMHAIGSIKEVFFFPCSTMLLSAYNFLQDYLGYDIFKYVEAFVIN